MRPALQTELQARRSRSHSSNPEWTRDSPSCLIPALVRKFIMRRFVLMSVIGTVIMIDFVIASFLFGLAAQLAK